MCKIVTACLILMLSIPVPAGNEDSPVGINVSTLDYWATEWPTIDLMKTASQWLPQNSTTWDTGEALDLDANGWVRSLPAADDPNVTYRYVTRIMRQGANGRYPAGQYIVLYDGEGTLSYRFDAIKNDALSTPGRDVLDVVPTNGGIALTINETDPNGTGEHIRNIRVIHPGGLCDAADPTSYCESADGNPNFVSLEAIVDTQIFHPLYLQNLANYKVVRFMDPLYVNRDQTSWDWSTRAQLTDDTWNTDKGIPYEAIIHFANLTNTDIWVNLPTPADNTFATEMARLFRDNLNPGIKLYVEYGNEIWNTIFAGSNWVQLQGETVYASSSESGFTKRINYYGQRTHAILKIWNQEWGSRADTDLVGVLGAQAASTWTATAALDCNLAYELTGERCSEYVDTIAIAPYFAGYFGNAANETDLIAWTTEPDGGLNNVFEEIFVGGVLTNSPPGGSLAQARAFIDAYITTAKNRNMTLTAYEGGSHLSGNFHTIQENDDITTMFTNANRDPRMRDAYLQYLAHWHNVGGDVFALWKSIGAYGRYGSWGLREYQDEPPTVKDSAVSTFIASTTYRERPANAALSQVCDGETTSFSVTASGTDLTYQWMKDGTVIAGEVGPTLNFASVTPGDAGTYQCEVTGQCNTVMSYPFVLEISGTPQLLDVTTSASHCDTTATGTVLSVTAIGQEPMTYAWYRDDAPLSITNPTLTLPTLTGNEGTYHCVVTDACGTVMQTLDIPVMQAQPAQITGHSSN